VQRLTVMLTPKFLRKRNRIGHGERLAADGLTLCVFTLCSVHLAQSTIVIDRGV
jgi:hypothetical protein